MLAIALIALLAAVEPVQGAVEDAETPKIIISSENCEEAECVEEIVFEDAVNEDAMADESIAFDEE